MDFVCTRFLTIELSQGSGCPDGCSSGSSGDGVPSIGALDDDNNIWSSLLEADIEDAGGADLYLGSLRSKLLPLLLSFVSEPSVTTISTSASDEERDLRKAGGALDLLARRRGGYS